MAEEFDNKKATDLFSFQKFHNIVVFLGIKLNRKYINVGNKLRLLLFSDNIVFEKLANITIFSLNIVENPVNNPEKVL